MSDLDRKNSLRYADNHHNKEKIIPSKSTRRTFSHTHLGYDFGQEIMEAETDFYINFAERPRYTAYEYRYMPILLYIFTQSIQANSFVTFNFYSFSRFQYLLNNYPLLPAFRDYSDPQAFFHEVVK